MCPCSIHTRIRCNTLSFFCWASVAGSWPCVCACLMWDTLPILADSCRKALESGTANLDKDERLFCNGCFRKMQQQAAAPSKPKEEYINRDDHNCCRRCGKRVFFAEQVLNLGYKWHKSCHTCCKSTPVNTRYRPSGELMLGGRRRRRAINKSTLHSRQPLVFAALNLNISQFFVTLCPVIPVCVRCLCKLKPNEISLKCIVVCSMLS